MKRKVLVFGYDSNNELEYEILSMEEFKKYVEKVCNERCVEKGYVNSVDEEIVYRILGGADQSKIAGYEYFETDEELKELLYELQ